MTRYPEDDDEDFDYIDDLDAARALAQRHPKSVPPELQELLDELDS